nr:uncharacterized protein CI109_006951 [Kwoniella shandongensis]KAA5524693.1 hypothetical protein CI109_006951 [Kwoniella shandongensis]
MPSWVTDNNFTQGDPIPPNQVASGSGSSSNTQAPSLAVPTPRSSTLEGKSVGLGLRIVEAGKGGRMHSPIVLSPDPSPPPDAMTNDENAVDAMTSPVNGDIAMSESSPDKQPQPLNPDTDAKRGSVGNPIEVAPTPGTENVPTSTSTITKSLSTSIAAPGQQTTSSSSPTVSSNAVAGPSTHRNQTIEVLNHDTAALAPTFSSSTAQPPQPLQANANEIDEFEVQTRGGQTVRCRVSTAYANQVHVLTSQDGASLPITKKELLKLQTQRQSKQQPQQQPRYQQQQPNQQQQPQIEHHHLQGLHNSPAQAAQTGRQSFLSTSSTSQQQQNRGAQPQPRASPLQPAVSTSQLNVPHTFAAAASPAIGPPARPASAARSTSQSQPAGLTNSPVATIQQRPEINMIRSRRNEALQAIAAHLSEAWNVLQIVDNQTFNEMNQFVGLFTQLPQQPAVPQATAANVSRLQTQLSEEREKVADKERTVVFVTESMMSLKTQLTEANEKVQLAVDQKDKSQHELQTMRQALEMSRLQINELMKRAGPTAEGNMRERKLDEEVRKLTAEKEAAMAEIPKLLAGRDELHRKELAKVQESHAKQVERIHSAHAERVQNIKNVILNHPKQPSSPTNQQAQSASASSNVTMSDDAHTAELAKLRENLKKNNQKMAELEEGRRKEVAELRAQLDPSNSSREKMKELSRKHVAREKELMEQKSTADKEIDGLTTKIKDLERQIAIAADSADSDTITRRALEKVLDWGENIQRLMGKDVYISGQSGEMERAEAFCASLQSVFSELQAKGNDKESNNAAEKIGELEKQLSGKTDTLKAMDELLTKQNQSVAALKKQLEEVESSLAAKESELETYVADLMLVQDETVPKVNEFRAERDALIREKQTWQAQLDDRSRAIVRLTEEMDDMKRQLDEVNDQLLTTSDERVRDRDELSAMERQLDQLREEKAQWKERTKVVKAELKAMKNDPTNASTSAKVTVKEEVPETTGPSQLKSSQTTPPRGPVSNRRGAQVTPLFLPRDDNDSESQPSTQTHTIGIHPPVRKRRRVESPEGNIPAATQNNSAIPTPSGSVEPIVRPVDRKWVEKNIGVCTQVAGGETRCKLCFVQEKKFAGSNGRPLPTMNDMSPLPSNWDRAKIVDHLLGHQSVLRKLKDKRVKEGKEVASP